MVSSASLERRPYFFFFFFFSSLFVVFFLLLPSLNLGMCCCLCPRLAACLHMMRWQDSLCYLIRVHKHVRIRNIFDINIKCCNKRDMALCNGRDRLVRPRSQMGLLCARTEIGTDTFWFFSSFFIFVTRWEQFSGFPDEEHPKLEAVKRWLNDTYIFNASFINIVADNLSTYLL